MNAWERSDRVLVNLDTRTEAERFRDGVRAQRSNMWWRQRKIASVVVELIHPGNLGPLPPSPKKCVQKAWDLGLITKHEYWAATTY